MATLNEMRDEVHEYAKSKGWWDEPRTFGDLIALCHTELSEALEQYRKGKQPDETYYLDSTLVPVLPVRSDKPEGVPSELIDVFIRIFDMAGYYGIDLDAIYGEKMEYNRQREYRHGGKVL